MTNIDSTKRLTFWQCWNQDCKSYGILMCKRDYCVDCNSRMHMVVYDKMESVYPVSQFIAEERD